MVFTKQIYFSSTYLKPWAHISDNITGVAGDLQERGGLCYYIRLFRLFLYYTLKSLLGLKKT